MALTSTLFNNLPFELRHLVWQLSLPDDEPEVLILRETNLEKNEDGIPQLMPVDTAFPALIHVCRESRSFVVQHSGIRFRFSPEAVVEHPAGLIRAPRSLRVDVCRVAPRGWVEVCGESGHTL